MLYTAFNSVVVAPIIVIIMLIGQGSGIWEDPHRASRVYL